MIKRPGKTASKETLLAAFDQLNTEYKKLETSIKNRPEEAPMPVATTAPASPDSPGVPGDHSIEGTIAGLTALQSDFGGAVSTLSAKLTAEATRLQGLRQETAELSRQLTELHGLEVADDTLQTVIQEYQTRSNDFRGELKEKREGFDRALAERLAAWQAEQEERSRGVKERDETLKKAQRRGVEEYDYDLLQRRKADADTYDQQRLGLQRELDGAVAVKDKAWAEGEKLVADREKLFQDYKARYDELPARLDAAVKKARGEGAGIAAAQAKVKADLVAKEIDGERRVFELRIKTFEADIKERATRIEALSQQLSVALKQGQDLAVKAIEGASNASSFGAVKEIALEQAKNLPKSKG